MNRTSNTDCLDEQVNNVLKNSGNKKPTSKPKQDTTALTHHKTLYESVTSAMEDYFSYLDGEPPAGLYQLVITQVECALLNFIMERVNHNRSKTAKCLGISRGTLLKKLAQHKIESCKKGA